MKPLAFHFLRSAALLRRRGWLFLLILLSLGKNVAADAAADFSAASELYARGKFAEAAAAYEKMLPADGQSLALLFDCGNAEFKAGHLGLAIAAYRRAELLAPRDAELRANLGFVRSQVPGAAQRESRWQNWLGALTLNETTVLAAVLFWALFALLASRLIRPALALRLRSATRWVSVLMVLAGALLAWQAANHFAVSVAVVTNPEAPARSGPFDDAQNVFTARDGAELRVLDRHDDWLQVADGAGKIGWLNRRQVALLPGA
jgi:tetratricopeptide (TPR) repeat protein